MRKLMIVATLTALVLAACGNAPSVLQGTVVGFDPNARTLLVQDELNPASRVTFSVENADIGADPRLNDVVRVAYRDVDGRLMATRVMNITRQGEFKKGGGAH